VKKLNDLSAQDYRYLHCTSFEVYMQAGLVFVLGFSGSFIVSFVIHQAKLFWPGVLISIIATGIVLQILKKREYQAKSRELEAEQAQKVEASET